MIHFRIRDLLSVALYRYVLASGFGRLGRGARIVWPIRLVGCRFMRLHDGVTLQYGAYIAVLRNSDVMPRLSVGAGTQIGNHAHIVCTQAIDIGERVLIADRVYISDNMHEYHNIAVPVMDQPLRQLNPVTIGAGSWIGENVCIIGSSVGSNSVIGANSMVNRNIPDRCVAVGIPAVPIKRFCPVRQEWRRTDSSGNFVD